MELIQQIEKWQRQADAARPDAAADMDVTRRLLKHGAEALAEIIRLESENLRLRKIAAHVPAADYIAAKERAGLGTRVRATDKPDMPSNAVMSRPVGVGSIES